MKSETIAVVPNVIDSGGNADAMKNKMNPPTRRKLFRPSSAPGLEKCAHFEPTISTSPNAARGTEMHAELCEKLPKLFYELKKTLDGHPEDLEAALAFVNPPYVRYALRILWQSGMKDISGTEQLVELHDKDGNFVTEGTCDLSGINENFELILPDFKSGQERDYSAQVVLYGLGRMQEDNFKKAWLYEVFLDQERTYRTEITRELAEERIFRIVESVRNPGEHTMNRYCDYCDKQSSCIAWEWERKKFAQGLPKNGAATWEGRLVYARSDLTQLAEFITTWKRMKKHVENSGLEKYALEQMKNGTKLDGLRLAKSSANTLYIALE
jgi:hypothetical protein